MNDEQDLRRRLAAQPRPTPRPTSPRASSPAPRATAAPAGASACNGPGTRRYGWQLKLASLALCGVLGLLAGHAGAPAGDADLEVAAQAMDQLLWTEEP